jgi:hypothetical protein
MWKLQARFGSKDVLYWLDRDIDEIYRPGELLVGPYHNRKGCMQHLQLRTRYHNTITYILPDKCETCGTVMHDGRYIKIEDLKVNTLKALQRVHNEGKAIKDGLHFKGAQSV